MTGDIPINMLKRYRLSKKGKGNRPLTQKELAAMAGIQNVETISKIERNKQNPTIEQALAFARIFGVDPGEFVLDRKINGASGHAPGLSEEAAPFTPEPDSFASRIPLTEHQSWYTVKDSRLDELGIIAGDEIVVDIGKNAMSGLAIGDIVVANLYSVDGKSAETICRQFIPPHLLITNSRTRNLPSLHIDHDNVSLLGVVVYPRRNPRKQIIPFLRS